MTEPTGPVPDPEPAPVSPSDLERPDAPATAAEKPAPHPLEDPLRGSAASRTWAALIALGLILVVVVAFVAQNTESVPVNLFGWTWNPPLAAALLAAVALGLSIALIAGSMRILQLRRRVRRNAKG